jgi:hypothetical protein
VFVVVLVVGLIIKYFWWRGDSRVSMGRGGRREGHAFGVAYTPDLDTSDEAILKIAEVTHTQVRRSKRPTRGQVVVTTDFPRISC